MTNNEISHGNIEDKVETPKLEPNKKRRLFGGKSIPHKKQEPNKVYAETPIVTPIPVPQGKLIIKYAKCNIYNRHHFGECYNCT